MKDILAVLNDLRRPKLLIRAARIGVKDYRRDNHLRQHFGYGVLPRSGPALMSLIEMESDLERMRTEKAASYSASRHVEVLIAMMGEARILRATHRHLLT